eukprot:TRINITY_DN25562_c0_g1_i1.p1 TRINITY_DN25562_c0_g1~~TRINITY_DN25562_c0_g1_i1.p1  ORF type:complete len:250 (+),score=47.95 TRINITY_DN25562_c0_g1_i1:35-751(+)
MKNVILIPGILSTGRIWAPVTKMIENRRIGKVYVHHLTEGKSVCNAADLVWQGARKHFKHEHEKGAYVIGHSYGGYVAAEMLRQEPNFVKGLGLVASQLRCDSDVMKERRRKLVAAASTTTEVIDIQRDLLLHPSNEHLLRNLYEMVTSVPYAVFKDQQEAAIHRPDATRFVASSDVPVLLATGQADHVIPLLAFKTVKEALRNNTPSCTVIPHVGHMTPLEAPDVLGNALCNWMKRN